MVFFFPVKDTLEIFGMEIDNELNFSKHISNICKKNNNQFNVMLRFRKLFRRDILLKLYKSYIFYLMFIQGTQRLFSVNICSKKQILPWIFFCLNAAKNF